MILQYIGVIKSMYKRRMIKEKRSEESGMIVVEAVITLTIFLIVISVIIFLMTIFTVHNKVQYALNSAAHEVAAYSYLYQALGLRGADQTVRDDGAEKVGNINATAGQVLDTIEKIESLAGAIGEMGDTMSDPQLTDDYMKKVYDKLDGLKDQGQDVIDSSKESLADIEKLLSDPKGLAAGIIYILAEEGGAYLKGVMGQLIARAMTKKYLDTSAENGGKTADEMLISHGVIDGFEGLDFKGSTMFCDGTQGWDPKGNKAKGDYRLIDFVVSYDIDLSFARLVLPEAKLHVVQRVTVPAWTNGDGKDPVDHGVTMTHR